MFSEKYTPQYHSAAVSFDHAYAENGLLIKLEVCTCTVGILLI